MASPTGEPAQPPNAAPSATISQNSHFGCPPTAVTQAQPKGESNRGHTKAVRQALAILAGVDNFMLAGSPSPSASARLFGGWPLSFQLNPQTSGHSLDRFNRGSQARGSFLQRG
jgi:hypothetical protein